MHRLALGKLPFYWRMSPAPGSPPNPVPDFVEFAFSFLEDYQLIVQERNPKTWEYLETIYRDDYNVGYLQEGHALAEGYGGDFLANIESAIARYNPGARRISEVGAGGGYILKKLMAKGYDVAAIDPSPIAIAKGREFGFDVIPEFYPSSGSIPKSDVILHYDVLEHVPDPVEFLRCHAADLNPGGLAVFAVPDCSPFIAYGDLSMILHEHLNYYDTESLRRVVEGAGLEALEVGAGTHGCVLFCVARVPAQAGAWTPAAGAGKFDAFVARVGRLRTQVERFIEDARGPGNSLGCYVPLRAVPYLALLGITSGVRFFDDNPGIHGQYFDGFPIPVEGLDALAANPVSHVLIMSFAFGDKIRSRIQERLPNARISILSLSDLDPSA